MRLPSWQHMYSTLIATPSISSDSSTNLPLIEKLAQWCHDAYFDITLMPIAGTNKANLLAQLGAGNGGLLLSGHSDTVACDLNQWHSDPFQLTEKDQRFYGLGAVDMKGFFAFVLEGVRMLKHTKLIKPLYLLATADEETTMAGAIEFAKTAAIKPDCIIIGEPTELIPVCAHKGQATAVIKITGKSGHGSDPSKGINAIEIMAQVIHRLRLLRQKLQERYYNPAFAISYPTLNLGQIQGGNGANRICSCCELTIDIRLLPGVLFEDIFTMLTTLLHPIMRLWPNRISIQLAHEPIPPYECSAPTTLLTAIEHLAGSKAQRVNYCTEAPYLNQIAPTFILGPGSIAQAHRPDEFLTMASIPPALKLYRDLIGHFCINQIVLS